MNASRRRERYQPPAAIQFAADGCALPNIRLQRFRVVFTGRCPHVKAPRITIEIMSTSPLDARRQAARIIGPRSLYLWESTETII